ncbi:MAG: oligosaccharide flippase family protein [Candidatus Omnitrophota bacterium]
MDTGIKQKQIKHSFLYIVSVLVSNLVTLVSLPIFTRILSKEDYGIFALAEVFGMFVTGLANFGMLIAYERNYFKYCDDRDKCAKLLYSTLLFTCANFTLFFLLACVLQKQLSFLVFRSDKYGTLLIFNLLADFIFSVQLYFLCFYKNSENARSNVSYSITYCLLNFILAFSFIALLRIGVSGLIYAKLIAASVITLVLVFCFLRQYPLSFDKSILFESVRLAYPLTPRIFLGVIGTKIDQYIIGLLGSLGAVGVYNIGQRVASMVFVYMTSLENVFSPYVYKKMFEQKEDNNRVIGQYLTIFAYISIFLALCVAIFSSEIISLLTPPAFRGAADIIIVLTLYYGFLFFNKITGMQLLYAKKTHISAALIISTYVLNIAMSIPFIIRWGAEGAAWATFLSGLISGTAYYIFAQKFYAIKWEYKKIGWIFLIFFSSATCVLYTKRLAPPYPVQLMLKMLLLSLYIMLGFLLGLISRSKFIFIKNALLKKTVEVCMVVGN